MEAQRHPAEEYAITKEVVVDTIVANLARCPLPMLSSLATRTLAKQNQGRVSGFRAKRQRVVE